MPWRCKLTGTVFVATFATRDPDFQRIFGGDEGRNRQYVWRWSVNNRRGFRGRRLAVVPTVGSGQVRSGQARGRSRVGLGWAWLVRSHKRTKGQLAVRPTYVHVRRGVRAHGRSDLFPIFGQEQRRGRGGAGQVSSWQGQASLGAGRRGFDMEGDPFRQQEAGRQACMAARDQMEGLSCL
ncbi:hypothetical protein LX32DRAFT_304321 [Colletotrichum zoysiae]|uniref:Uncharacterized protein n=1 Tax=Colletotrichum zoysiae TaxID=1216348 RepID=A0AAD9H1I2_9PEZI|nr:hypothetical protein LX32DRAFT_304321 [Colletotrichum zoysiae]